MFPISGLRSRIVALLAERLGLLDEALSNLGQRLRATIASHVAAKLARLVQEVVETVLSSPDLDPVPRRRTYLDSARWQETNSLSSSYYPDSESTLFDGYHDEPGLEDEDAMAPQCHLPEPAAEKPRLHVALITGLRAGAWYLGRRKASSLLTALAIGVSAGAVALFGGPVLAAGAATVCSLLVLTG